MSKIGNVTRKLDSHLNRILKIILEKMNVLEDENKIYKEEIIRLESLVKDLISIIAEDSEG